MDKIVMALFRYQLQIDEAFHDLLKIGFSPSHMKYFSNIGNQRKAYKIATIGSHRDDPYADKKSELFHTLLQMGCPKDDAFLLTEGVRRGGKLAVVFARQVDVDFVSRVFRRHDALDLQSRKKFAEENRLRPSEGLSESPFTTISQNSNYEDDLADWVHSHREVIGRTERVRIFDKPIEIEDKKLDKNLNE